MNPQRKKRLILIGVMFCGLAIFVGLILIALREQINLFYSPTAIAEGQAPLNEFMRAGGMVVDGSVKRDSESLQVEFKITDYQHEVLVQFDGILPDLFREGQGIVAIGQLTAPGVFKASEVLAKHDEEYMPPEVAEALGKTAGEHAKPGAYDGKSYEPKSYAPNP